MGVCVVWRVRYPGKLSYTFNAFDTDYGVGLDPVIDQWSEWVR